MCLITSEYGITYAISIVCGIRVGLKFSLRNVCTVKIMRVSLIGLFLDLHTK